MVGDNEMQRISSNAYVDKISSSYMQR